MFIAPALCYELLAGYLQAKNRDRLVCIWRYALRVTVPLLLPVMALFTSNRSVLFCTAIFVFGFGFTMAAFANNTLSVLYRNSFRRRSSAGIPRGCSCCGTCQATSARCWSHGS